MRELIGFLRREALIASSYRTRMVFSLGSLLALVIPLYFISGAVQPLIGDAIATEGGQYFAFLVVGLATFQFVTTAVGAIPAAVSSGLQTGTFESLLSTPTRVPLLLAGMMMYPFLWTAARALALILAGVALGADLSLAHLALALPIWGAVVLAYAPIGLLCSALLLTTRTAGPIPGAVIALSMFLGGVYYPTTVVPSWLRHVSEALPLTYGLRALRRTLSGDVPASAVALDLASLLAFAGVLLALGLAAVHLALQHARRWGSLAQY